MSIQETNTNVICEKTQTEIAKNALTPSKDPEQILKRVLERMQAYSLTTDAPHLSREQLHERR